MERERERERWFLVSPDLQVSVYVAKCCTFQAGMRERQRERERVRTAREGK